MTEGTPKNIAWEINLNNPKTERPLRTGWIGTLKKDDALRIASSYLKNIQGTETTEKLRKKIRKLVKTNRELGVALQSIFEQPKDNNETNDNNELEENRSETDSEEDSDQEQKITMNSNEPTTGINLTLKPDNFNGRGSIDKFLQKYEYTSKINGWDDEKKKAYIPSFLNETAFDFFVAIDRSTNPNWKDLTKQLRERFGKQLNVAELELQNRKLEKTESMTEYFTSVITLCGEVDENMAEKRIINNIIKGLPENMVNMVVPMRSKTITELQANIGEAEYAIKLNENQRKNDLNKEIEEIKEKLDKLNVNSNKENTKTFIDELTEAVTEKMKIQQYERNKVNNTGDDRRRRGFDRSRGQPRRRDDREGWYKERKNDYQNNGRGYRGNRGFRNQRGFRNRGQGYRGRNQNYFRGQNSYRGNGYFPQYQQPFPQLAYYPPSAIMGPPQNTPQQQNNQTQITCFSCKQPGHMAKTCPNNQGN